MQLRQIARLDEWYGFATPDTIFITGLQALTRLLLAQSHRDRAAGLNTAGFVSGYRGSPLGGLDRELWRAAPYLEAAAHPLRAGLERGPRRDGDLGHAAGESVRRRPLRRRVRHVVRQGPRRRPLRRRAQARQRGRHVGARRRARRRRRRSHAASRRRCRTRASTRSSTHRFPCSRRRTCRRSSSFGLYGYALSRFSGCWIGVEGHAGNRRRDRRASR